MGWKIVFSPAKLLWKFIYSMARRLYKMASAAISNWWKAEKKRVLRNVRASGWMSVLFPPWVQAVAWVSAAILISIPLWGIDWHIPELPHLSLKWVLIIGGTLLAIGAIYFMVKKRKSLVVSSFQFSSGYFWAGAFMLWLTVMMWKLVPMWEREGTERLKAVAIIQTAYAQGKRFPADVDTLRNSSSCNNGLTARTKTLEWRAGVAAAHRVIVNRKDTLTYTPDPAKGWIIKSSRSTIDYKPGEDIPYDKHVWNLCFQDIGGAQMLIVEGYNH